MKIKPIHNETEYEEALTQLESIFHAEIGTEEGDQAEILSILIEKYEDEHYPIPLPNNEEKDLEFDFNYIYELVKQTSSAENGSIVEKGLKLNEEVGELSAELLKIVGYKHTTDSHDVIMEKALLESVDSLIMIFDIMIKLGFTKDQIVEMAEKQVNKWLNYIK
jgi:hypothetical protein